MLKTFSKILFAGLITVSLIGQGTIAIADLCSPTTTASAEAITLSISNSAHGAHDHASATHHHSSAESPVHGTSFLDCCGDSLCFIDNCATSVSLNIVASALPEPFVALSVLNLSYAESHRASIPVAFFRPPIFL